MLSNRSCVLLFLEIAVIDPRLEFSFNKAQKKCISETISDQKLLEIYKLEFTIQDLILSISN
jgi:hypothetical protein